MLFVLLGVLLKCSLFISLLSVPLDFVYFPKIVFCVRRLFLAYVLILASVFVLPNCFFIWFRSMLDRFLH